MHRNWVDLNHRPRPYQGLLWCYMHSSVAMITTADDLNLAKRQASPRPNALVSHDTLRCRSSRGLPEVA